jgi:hypothetical protein
LKTYVIAVALVGVVHRFGQKLVRNRTAAIITPLLILLNGGFGWMMLWDDVGKVDGGVYQVLKRLAHSYTILPEIEKGWRWGNSITSLLVTQRGFLLGIPLAVIVIQLWWEALNSEGEKGKGEKGKTAKATPNAPNRSPFSLFPLTPSAKRMLAAGIIAGLLPLIHAHTFITLLMVATFLVPWVYWRAWAAYGLAILGWSLSVPAGRELRSRRFGPGQSCVWRAAGRSDRQPLLFLAVVTRASLALFLCRRDRHWRAANPLVDAQERGEDAELHRVAIWLGQRSAGDVWFETGRVAADRHGSTFSKWLQRLPYVAWFWLKNTGLFIPLLLIALVWKPDDYLVPRRLLLFYLPFTLAFFVPNFVKLAAVGLGQHQDAFLLVDCLGADRRVAGARLWEAACRSESFGRESARADDTRRNTGYCSAASATRALRRIRSRWCSLR